MFSAASISVAVIRPAEVETGVIAMREESRTGGKTEAVGKTRASATKEAAISLSAEGAVAEAGISIPASIAAEGAVAEAAVGIVRSKVGTGGLTVGGVCRLRSRE